MTTGGNEGPTATEGADGHDATGAPATGAVLRSHAGWAALARVWRGGGRRHLRLVTTAAAVLVAAGAVGGYVSLSSTDAPSLAGRTKPHAPHVDAATSQSPSSDAAGATGSDGAGSGAIACPMIPAGTGATGDDVGLGGATHLFTRTTADGVTIRAYHLSSTGLCTCDALGDDAVSVELSDAAAVGQGELLDPLGSSATTANAVTEPVGTTSSAFGITEGAPVWWVAVSVGPEIASVEMTFGDGSKDQMTPIDGVVVLAHQIDPSVASSGDGPYEVRGTLRLLDASGAVVTTVTFPAPVSEPVPVPFPERLPLPASDSPPMTVARPTTPGSVPVLSSPSTSTGSAVACPQVTAPVNATAG